MKKLNYNGWKNRQTWNVALHISNDYDLYTQAVDFVKKAADKNHNCLYMVFVKKIGLRGQRTPDNIAYDGSRLDYKELNRFMLDLIN